MLTISVYVDISLVILIVRFLSLEDSLGSAHESIPEFLMLIIVCIMPFIIESQFCWI